jgi:hypothetical protein
MGRRRVAITADQVERLARIGCTQEEIAEVLGCAQATISLRFSMEYARARASMKMSLRRAQYRRAVKDRSDTMLCWLGRHVLGQSGESDGMSGQEVLARILADHARKNGKGDNHESIGNR